MPQKEKIIQISQCYDLGRDEPVLVALSDLGCIYTKTGAYKWIELPLPFNQ